MGSMKRWSGVVVLLLLLPLTLAPRTSWTLDSVMYDLLAGTPRDTVRPKAGVPLRLVLKSRADEPITAQLVIDVNWNSREGTAVVAGASSGCEIDRNHVVCTVRVLPRSARTVTVVARPLAPGQLVFDVDEGFGGEDFGTVTVDVVRTGRASGARR